ncbi:hypothetical protein GGR27_000289 [Lewinella antarctica]|uniref:Uncharacterized protein n=1 Tax=Neolewinella antarctica TaxID=442734 RepID=A0ABX0X716_9BACT|nr:hypothetical protein [Neolewinella antarctica]
MKYLALLFTFLLCTCVRAQEQRDTCVWELAPLKWVRDTNNLDGGYWLRWCPEPKRKDKREKEIPETSLVWQNILRNEH